MQQVAFGGLTSLHRGNNGNNGIENEYIMYLLFGARVENKYLKNKNYNYLKRNEGFLVLTLVKIASPQAGNYRKIHINPCKNPLLIPNLYNWQFS